jgi:hypothetical protein
MRDFMDIVERGVGHRIRWREVVLFTGVFTVSAIITVDWSRK